MSVGGQHQSAVCIKIQKTSQTQEGKKSGGRSWSSFKLETLLSYAGNVEVEEVTFFFISGRSIRAQERVCRPLRLRRTLFGDFKVNCAECPLLGSRDVDLTHSLLVLMTPCTRAPRKGARLGNGHLGVTRRPASRDLPS
ncbi:hypothetical protein BgiMline_001033 [Biomphalaria glabrata]|nr:hypothetical protein BgiMline_000958 [Biomphalaria glabrata]